MTVTNRFVKIQKVLRRISAIIWTILDGALMISLSHQTNFETVPESSHYRFLPNPSKLIYCHTIRNCLVSILQAPLNNNNIPLPHTDTHIHFRLQTVHLLKSHVIPSLFPTYSHMKIARLPSGL
jgi:hypothetical protein